MWSRMEMKSDAKEFLRKYYLQAFIVCLLTTLFMGGGSSNSANNDNETMHYEETTMIDDVTEGFPVSTDNPVVVFATRRFRSPLFLLGAGTFLVLFFVLLFLSVTIGFSLEVGQSRFFLDGYRGETRVNRLFSVFNSREYFPVVRTQFLRSLYTFLWTLLFIIPGVMKAYEYRFVPYILAEDPLLASGDVLFRSKEMTRGRKMDLFVLDLSFIGWYILGGFLFGVGTFLVDPYAQATNARVYVYLSGEELFVKDLETNQDEFGDW